MPNRLASEQSPYLLQHKNNPVDWYPWGDEAFARARAENKPIFLSIGYSTCHWCHVMEHESFEDAAIAELLRTHFIAIKVDREERPDVDRVYMTFVQATTGSGGWPMSVWLTPALAPFYGGTYYPPTSRWGRPGFTEVLQEIARAWREEHDKVLQSSAHILGRLRSLGAVETKAEVPGTAILDRAVQEFAGVFDASRGGFGGAPKFPRPSELLFLLREHARTGEAVARDMVLLTLRAMALGGMRDHVGGGFHRYSVDGEWRVPHFEKMLYDQAQLVLAYLEAHQVTGDQQYADVAADTLAYVQRDLTDPEGGFYSAEDADSVPPGQASSPHPHKVEGAFYVWTDEEIRALLGKDADLFASCYGVRPGGNAPADPQGEFENKNLLYTAAPASDEELERLAQCRRTLFTHRETRPKPHLDDKVLTAWNGLMIAAFARAGRVLANSGFTASGQRAASFIQRTLWQPETGTLLRRYRQGAAAVPGYAEDYAYLVFGLLELFQTDGDPAWLEWALELQRRQDALFWDPAGGGWFSTTGQDRSVLLRLKEDYDGAEPSASAVGLLNLMTLEHLTADPSLAPKIELTLRLFAARAAQSGRTVPMALAALSTYHSGMPQVVLVGADAAEIAPFEEIVRRAYLPTTVLVPVSAAHAAKIAGLLPWVEAMRGRDGAAAYVCRDFTCEAPVTDPRALAALLVGSDA